MTKNTALHANNDLYETSLGYMFKLSAPMVVTTISMTLMQFVDRFMVSKLGTDALAAIWPASLVAFLFGGFAMGAFTSLNTFVSQSLGRGNNTECSKYFWQSVYMGLFYCIMVLIIIWPIAPLIFRIMMQPEGVAELEVIYLRILLYAHIIAVLNWSSNHFFMGIHRPIITMIAALSGQLINIIVNYLLIFGNFGFPKLGIAGAGWGTFAGISVAACINISVYLSSRMNSAFQTKKTLKIDTRKMRDLLRIGLPSGFVLTLNVGLWGVILSALIGKFGKEALAATSAVLSYTNLSIMPVVGISISLTAAVGRIIGKGRKDLAIKQTNLCLKVALIYMGSMGACFFLFRNSLMSFLSKDNQVINSGVDILICAAFYQVFHAARTIYGGTLRGAGDTPWMAVVSAFASVFILGVGGYLATKLLPSLGALGPWIAATLSVVAIGIAFHWRFKSNKWQEIDLFRHKPFDIPVETEPMRE
ncbi:MAG: MATE family efflux transporter [Sedimentisphaerales bacterium]|nr:MATE family efflux transporter [Sedimentisphaerales bacterium]